MKELSIEQKAKAYDEAIKKAESLYKVSEPMSGCNVIIETLFPELKESWNKDEKIRKALINGFNKLDKSAVWYNGITNAQILDWLEKQAEHANFRNKIQIGDKVTKNRDGVLVNLSQLNRVAKVEEKQGEQKPVPKFKIGDTMRTLQEAKDGCTDGMPFVVSIDSECYNCNSEKIAIKNQDGYEYPPINRKHDVCDYCNEQKHIDKVEPKFHEGEWVFIEEIKGYKQGPFQIKSVNEFGYNFDEYHTIPFMYEELLSKWNIQDAKDGDVLKEDSCIFIIEKMNPNGTAIVHCCLFDDGDFDLIGSTLGFDEDSTYPATKEQRDLLFQKMKEAGFEWDADKKKLKKIVTPIFHIGDRVRYKGHSCDGVITEITDTDYICGDAKLPISTQDEFELVEQKPDDNVEPKFKKGDRVIGIISGMQYYITEVCNDYYYTESGCIIMFCAQDNFNLYEQNSTWSEEDEKQLNNIMWIIEAYRKNGFNETHIQIADNSENWLKSLKDKCLPQPKQEWSEEDDKNLKGAIQQMDLLEEYINDGSFVTEVAKQFSLEVCRSVKNWLKSLRPQKHWNPSDEQMVAIDTAINVLGKGSLNGKQLIELQEQLKKLKG